jgi:hypothetical protein
MDSETDNLIVTVILYGKFVSKNKKEFHIKTHTAFVNFKKAFDRVNRRKY